jgi:hypothetical protein
VIEAQYQRLLSYPQQHLERMGWRQWGIDCQLPPEVPTQIGIDYRALVKPEVLIGETSFVFIRRAAAFGKRGELPRNSTSRVSHSENEYPRRCEIMKVRERMCHARR